LYPEKHGNREARVINIHISVENISMKKKYFISKKVAFIIISVAVTVFVSGLWYLSDEGKTLGENATETYAVVIATNLSQAQGNPFFKYEFSANGASYQGFLRYNPEWEKISIGETCVVKYEKLNPQNNRFDRFIK